MGKPKQSKRQAHTDLRGSTKANYIEIGGLFIGRLNEYFLLLVCEYQLY
jgi:hypothetical protein